MSVKINHIICIVLVCLTAVLSPLSAATRLNPEQRNFIYLSGSFGYSGMIHNMPEAKIPSGVAPSIAVGYRCFYNNFIFQTGIEGKYAWMKSVMPEVELRERMVDADINHEPFTMSILLNNRQDIYQTVSVSVPLYFGYEKGRFYFLAGVAAGIDVYGKAASSSVLTTRAEYDQLIGVFEQMPNHGLTTINVESGDVDMGMVFNLMAHLEMGGRINHMFKHQQFRLNPDKVRMYLAAFADCGALSLNRKGAYGDQLTMDYSHGVNATIVPLMLSNQMTPYRMIPLTVGVKFTIAFELPSHGKSYIYDYNKSVHDRKRGGNQGIKY